jgi:hypothetical protein
LNGKLLKQEMFKQKLDVSELPTGIYRLKFYQGGINYVGKFMKE